MLGREVLRSFPLPSSDQCPRTWSGAERFYEVFLSRFPINVPGRGPRLRGFTSFSSSVSRSMSPDAVRGKRGFVKFPRHVTSRSSLKQRCQDHADGRVADSVAPRVPDKTNNGVLNSRTNHVTDPCRFVRLGLLRSKEALPPPFFFLLCRSPATGPPAEKPLEENTERHSEKTNYVLNRPGR